MSATKDASIDAVNAAADRITAALKDGGKVKGFRGPDHGKRVGKKRRRVTITQRQHIELTAGDLVTLASSVSNAAGANTTAIVAALLKGASVVDPETPVTIYADDAFHIVEQHQAAKMTP